MSLDLTKDLTKGNIFYLSRLPIVAMREVIQYLTVPERIKLAITSKKMKRNISYSKVPTSYCAIIIKDELSYIYLGNGKFRMYCGRKFHHRKLEEHLKKEDLKPWLNENETIIENIVRVLQKVSEIVKFTSVKLRLNLEEMKSISVEQVLSAPELDIWQIIDIDGEYITLWNICWIVEKASEERSIQMTSIIHLGIDYPDSFANQLMEFHDIELMEASWIQIRYLLPMRNKGTVFLKETKLSLEDINELIKTWIDNDCDMFKTFDITQNDFLPDNLITLNAVLQDCVNLHIVRGGVSSFLVIANPAKVDRKWRILNVLKEKRSGLSLDALSPDEPANYETTVAPFTKEFEILKILNEMKQMEDEMQSFNLILTTDIEENERKKLIGKRKELKGQIETMKSRIEKENVRFVDGGWKMNEN